jgi:hypothetical protein
MTQEDDAEFYWVFTSAYSRDGEEEWHGVGWTDFAEAAKEIMSNLGMSLGFAETKLRELCAAGYVKSMKYDAFTGQPDEENPPETALIKPSEWVGAQLDLALTPPYTTVAVSTDDLRYWIAQQAIAGTPPTEPTRSSQKRDHARKSSGRMRRRGGLRWSYCRQFTVIVANHSPSACARLPSHFPSKS